MSNNVKQQIEQILTSAEESHSSYRTRKAVLLSRLGSVCELCCTTEKLRIVRMTNDPECPTILRMTESWNSDKTKSYIENVGQHYKLLCRICEESLRHSLIHGTRAAYDRGCRCLKCRTAKFVANRKYKEWPGR